MLMTVTTARSYINTELSDQALEYKIQGLEKMVRAYTHNNFQLKNIRSICSCDGEKILGLHPLIKVGDTVEITNSRFNDDIYTVVEILDSGAVFNKPVNPEENLKITKVFYPEDVVLGAVKLLDWDINRSDKLGIQSETISRHSVTYSDGSTGKGGFGFPNALTGFLEPYRKARF